MSARECVAAARQPGDGFQRIINAFVDDFRRADARQRDALIRDPIERSGTIEGLVAAVVSQLCRETGLGAAVGPAHRQPGPVLRVSGTVVRAASQADDRIAAAVPRQERLRPRELSEPSVSAAVNTLPGFCTTIGWDETGGTLLVATQSPAGHVLWALDALDGPPRALPIEAARFWDVSVSPDGRLGYTDGDGPAQLWRLTGISSMAGR